MIKWLKWFFLDKDYPAEHFSNKSANYVSSDVENGNLKSILDVSDSEDDLIYYKVKKSKFNGLCGFYFDYYRESYYYYQPRLMSCLLGHRIVHYGEDAIGVKVWCIPDNAIEITKEEYEANVKC